MILSKGGPRALVIMGVSGSGKSTVGKAVAGRMGWAFYDGDDFHPLENVAKMASGHPLNDEDRAGWLTALHTLLAENMAAEIPLIVACSALTLNHRDQLRAGLNGVVFVYLRGSYDLIFRRMQSRHRHYMKAEMLTSQFETLEEPKNALTVDIDQKVDTIVDQIINAI